MHERGEADGNDEAGQSPVVSDDAGASGSEDDASEADRGSNGLGLEDRDDDEGGMRLPPAPGFSAPDDVELLVRSPP